MRPTPLGPAVLAFALLPAVAAADTYSVGVAQVDVTPTYPVRLSGFGFRRSESEGVTQKIWAKALAVGDREPAVLITADNVAEYTNPELDLEELSCDNVFSRATGPIASS